VGESSSEVERRWSLRPVPAAVAAHYHAEGWWNDESLGDMVAAGLGHMGEVPFRVLSKVRPWTGTVAEVDRSARALAAALHADGVGPGDVVLFQLPNWVEAGITFWAAAYLGAVVVPVVHFYGPKEVDYIIRTVSPSVVVTADRFAHNDFLANYEPLLADQPQARWFVVGDTPADELPAGARPLESVLGGEPIAGPLAVDPDLPAIIAFTSGTTRDPKGVIHSHRTIGCETRQLDHMFPGGGPPQITGAPVGHFIGMVNAFLVPLLRERSVNLIDVWDPGEILRLMLAEGLGVSGGATYFLTSLLDHPDFTSEHLALMPFAGLGGSAVPVAVTQRATDLGMIAFRSYGSTEHPSITGSLIDDPEVKRLTTDGHALPGVELKLDDEGEILSRGPDRFVGYIDPELTAAVFDDDGWYHTGDVGVLDEEGYLTITDRISDVIIRGGENIGAVEIEDLVLGMSEVAEVCVVAEPDERLGEHAAAIVRVHEGRTPPTVEAMRDHLAAAGLARQKWPEAVYAVADLPRTPSGKVQKFKLRKQLRDGELAAAAVGGEVPRIPPLAPTDWPDGMRDAMAALRTPNPRHPFPARDPNRPKGLNALGTLAQHPALTTAYHTFNGHVLFGTTLSPRQRELLVLRVAKLRDATYEWTQHVVLAGDAGITPEEVGMIAEGPDAAGWSTLEQAMVRAADELVTDARIADDTWATLAAELTVEQLMDVVFTVGAYDLLAMAFRSFGVQLDDDLRH
jgi:acyl-CoA synthetase